MKTEKSYYSGRLFVHLFLLLFCIACLVPFLLVVSSSLSDEMDLAQFGYSLIPKRISFAAYQYVLQDPKQIIQSYSITILITIIGTIISLFFTSMIAYALARKDFHFKNPLSFYVFFTMLFNGGLVPWYILMSQYLHLKNTIWALILPFLIVPWFVFLLRAFFSSIPDALIESAKIEGAGDFRIYVRITLPISLPAMATVGLFIILMYWNDWWLALLLLDKPALYPIQYLLYSIMANIDYLTTHVTNNSVSVVPPSESARMAMAVLAITPILFAYLFVQKYFIRGLTVGAVKG